jgi:hypothetical protein
MRGNEVRPEDLISFLESPQSDPVFFFTTLPCGLRELCRANRQFLGPDFL